MNMAWPDLDDEWEHAVAAYLRANPDWLADHPELYGALAPPARIHGEAMADHMAAMLGRARRDAACMAAQAGAVLAAQRATSMVAARVQEAVVALIGCSDVDACLVGEVARVLELDAVCLCRLEGKAGVPPPLLPIGTPAGGSAPRPAFTGGVASDRAAPSSECGSGGAAPSGGVGVKPPLFFSPADEQAPRLLGLLGRRDVVFREMPADAALLYAEAAPLAAWDVLIRLPGFGVLALAARGDRGGAPRHAGAAFQFPGAGRRREARAAWLRRRARRGRLGSPGWKAAGGRPR